MSTTVQSVLFYGTVDFINSKRRLYSREAKELNHLGGNLYAALVRKMGVDYVYMCFLKHFQVYIVGFGSPTVPV